MKSANKNAPRRTTASGFSLVELMIVISIIGILVAIGIPAWQSSVRSTNQAPTWGVNADPQKPTGLTATGSQFFYFGSDAGNVRTNPEKSATAEDPPVGG